jgi:hypothetical protein
LTVGLQINDHDLIWLKRHARLKQSGSAERVTVVLWLLLVEAGRGWRCSGRVPTRRSEKQIGGRWDSYFGLLGLEDVMLRAGGGVSVLCSKVAGDGATRQFFGQGKGQNDVMVARRCSSSRRPGMGGSELARRRVARQAVAGCLCQRRSTRGGGFI